MTCLSVIGHLEVCDLLAQIDMLVTDARTFFSQTMPFFCKVSRQKVKTGLSCLKLFWAFLLGSLLGEAEGLLIV